MICVDDLMIVFDNSCTDVNSKSHDLIQDDTNMNDVCNVIVVYEDLQNKATIFSIYNSIFRFQRYPLIDSSFRSFLPRQFKQKKLYH